MLGILIAAAYFGLWPVPINAVSWEAPSAPGFAGPHAANRKLQDRRDISLGGETGPESIVFGDDGKLYAAVAGGRVMRMHPDGSGLEVFASTGGRPLGLAFDRRGHLVVADAMQGLLSVSPDRTVSVLTKTVDGSPIRFSNAVAVTREGKVYFSDSSTRFVPAEQGSTQAAALLDILEQSATGRVLEYDPATRATRVVARGLSFPNGVALARDEKTLFVAESGRYRVWNIDVDAAALDMRSQSGKARVLLENLPGFPDNLTRGSDGRIWLGFGGQRNGLDAASNRPFMRELVLRIPRILWPVPKGYGHVIAFTEEGTVVADFQDPSGDSPTTTGATEAGGRIFIQNVDGKSLGWLTK